MKVMEVLVDVSSVRWFIWGVLLTFSGPRQVHPLEVTPLHYRVDFRAISDSTVVDSDDSTTHAFAVGDRLWVMADGKGKVYETNRSEQDKSFSSDFFSLEQSQVADTTTLLFTLDSTVQNGVPTKRFGAGHFLRQVRVMGRPPKVTVSPGDSLKIHTLFTMAEFWPTRAALRAGNRSSDSLTEDVRLALGGSDSAQIRTVSRNSWIRLSTDSILALSEFTTLTLNPTVKFNMSVFSKDEIRLAIDPEGMVRSGVMLSRQTFVDVKNDEQQKKTSERVTFVSILSISRLP